MSRSRIAALHDEERAEPDVRALAREHLAQLVPELDRKRAHSLRDHPEVDFLEACRIGSTARTLTPACTSAATSIGDIALPRGDGKDAIRAELEPRQRRRRRAARLVPVVHLQAEPRGLRPASSLQGPSKISAPG